MRQNIMKYKTILAVTLLFISSTCFAFDSGKSGYQVKVGNAMTEYTVMSFFLLPEQKVIIQVSKQGKPVEFSYNGSEQLHKQFAYTAADKPTMESIQIQPQGEAVSTIHIFVMHPMSMVKNGKLNGYTIGQYPKDVYKGLDIYKAPKGFVEVTPANKDLQISPHYKLGQFLCKQAEGFPKYVVLQTRLLRKLEYLTEAVNKKGIAMESFTIMSGYRTPYYNALIKNKTFSRHQWGGAADIYVDVNPKDGVMDDLDGDGKITVADAKFLWNMAESFFKNDPYYQKYFIGGLGLYRANSVRGPFVHVDVRGSRARW